MYFLIGADIVPTEKNIAWFEKCDTTALLGKELCEILAQANYRIFNLETPLTDRKKPIVKCGPNLIASESTIAGYRALSVDLVTLANNHILDQDAQGLYDTCRCLRKNEIDYLGAGKNIQEAQKPYLFCFADKKIGIYACAEHEFNIATENSAGANPFDPLESLDHIENLKRQCDYEIVLYHGGKEHYQYPSPQLQKVCRKIVDKGADLVVCQHTHCIGCEEKWKNGTIVYGQGNFLFDDCRGLYTDESVLIKINEKFEISYLPMRKGEGCVHLAEQADGVKILRNMEERSKEILADDFLEKRYREYSKKMCVSYLSRFSELCQWLPIRVLNKLTGCRTKEHLIDMVYTKKKLLAMENFIECEAHRELLLQIVREKQKMK